MQGSKPCALPLGDAPRNRLLPDCVSVPADLCQRRTVESPGKDCPVLSGDLPAHSAGGILEIKGGKNRCAGTCQPRFGKTPKPVKRLAHLRVTSTDDGQAVVPHAAREKVAYFDPGRVPCQIRIGKNLRR